MRFPYFEDPAYELVSRILALIPDHPDILEMENPRDLFKIEGFECTDLALEYNQAAWAFGRAKHEYAESQ